MEELQWYGWKDIELSVELVGETIKKKAHPDNGGSTEEFMQLQQDMKDCMDYIEQKEK